jgi:outer membrane receptor protein involved in Fe transport
MVIRHSRIQRAVRLALLASTLPIGATAALAQDQAADELAEIVVSGTRIAVAGLNSSSPIYSVEAAQIEQLQQPEVEKIFRLLPITLPADGQNTNNASNGAATIDLRGMGPQRNLIMMDGKRLTPFNTGGQIDTQQIPTALIERIDIITGGASAVYGSDAVSGAINFIMKRDFEGIEIDSNYSQTDVGDGKIKNTNITWGANGADGRSNFVLNLNWSDREEILLGARTIGRLGIDSETGLNLDNYRAGRTPAPAAAGCGGPDSVAIGGGSPTTLPTRVAIAGGPPLGQFREDGTLGADCSEFNFNPYNYFQTPQKRFGGIAMGRFDLNETTEVYGRVSISSTDVNTQVAPSGYFASPAWTPLANPFLTAQARSAIIAAAEAGRTAIDPMGVPAPTVNTAGDFPNWRDLNGNGVVDAADDLLISYRRRTVEVGPRSQDFNSDTWTLQFGVRGKFLEGWSYDLWAQRGEVEREITYDGYTNIAAFENAVNAVSRTQCRGGVPGCAPVNMFGGFGSITPEMASYIGVNAIETQRYEQTIAGATVAGSFENVKTAWTDKPLGVSVGLEYREEKGRHNPDACLRTPPASCLGGAGGTTLPISGKFDVQEIFGEAILPLVADKVGMQSLDLELGYRFSDYTPSGANKTWKYGLNYRPVDSFLFRVMQQRAARAPNISEIASPVRSTLSNVTLDPCSIANAMGINATLAARCMSTGMTAAQVGTVEDIAAGQVASFAGTDLANLPKPELADTLTLGVVWTPSFEGRVSNVSVALDYYDIDVQGVIGNFGAQEVLDGCYQFGLSDICRLIVRVGGTLTLPGAGLNQLTRNLDYLRTEGVELGASFTLNLGNAGKVRFDTNYNKYLTQEFQSLGVLGVTECLGLYGKTCGNPLPDTRWVQRANWTKGPFDLALIWRHLGETQVEAAQRSATFDPFERIDATDYIDLSAGWRFNDQVRARVGITNLTDEDPPAIGNATGSTATNVGNTFPAVFDPVGRVLSFSVVVTF